jgi:hypothetical protein
LTLETEVPAGLLSAADILALDAVVVDFDMPPEPEKTKPADGK